MEAPKPTRYDGLIGGVGAAVGYVTFAVITRESVSQSDELYIHLTDLEETRHQLESLRPEVSSEPLSVQPVIYEFLDKKITAAQEDIKITAARLPETPDLDTYFGALVGVVVGSGILSIVLARASRRAVRHWRQRLAEPADAN